MLAVVICSDRQALVLWMTLQLESHRQHGRSCLVPSDGSDGGMHRKHFGFSVRAVLH